MKRGDLIYYDTDEFRNKLALVGKVGSKKVHLLEMTPSVRLVKVNRGAAFYDPDPNTMKGNPGRHYRRVGRREGITKGAAKLLKGIA